MITCQIHRLVLTVVIASGPAMAGTPFKDLMRYHTPQDGCSLPKAIEESQSRCLLSRNGASFTVDRLPNDLELIDKDLSITISKGWQVTLAASTWRYKGVEDPSFEGLTSLNAYLRTIVVSEQAPTPGYTNDEAKGERRFLKYE